MRHPCEEIGYGVYCDLAYRSTGKFEVYQHELHVMYMMPHGVSLFFC